MEEDLPAAAAAPGGGDAEMADAPGAAPQATASDAENRNTANAAAGSTADKEGGAAAAAQGGEAGAGAPPAKKATKVPQQKYNNVKVSGGRSEGGWVGGGVSWRRLAAPDNWNCSADRSLHRLPSGVRILLSPSHHSTLARPPALPLNLPYPHGSPLQNLLVMHLQRLEEEGSGERREVGHDEVTGARQRDLLEWYFKYLVER